MLTQPEAAPVGAETAGGRVLLVEDNDMVRRLTLGALEAAGHTVVEAAEGVAALEALAREAPFDLLVVDLVLPGMDGYAIAERALALSPGLRVLFTSGYAAPESLAIEGAKAVDFLQKPFHVRALTAVVADLLATA